MREAAVVIKSNLLSAALVALPALLRRDDPAWLEISPNPYVLASLVLPAVFGLRRILPVLVAVPAFFVACLARKHASTTFSALLASEEMLTPIIMIAGAVVIGAITDGRIGLTRRTRDRMQQMIGFIQDKELMVSNLAEQTKRLSERLALDHVPVTQLLNFTAKLSGGSSRDVSAAIIEFLSIRLGEKNCYIYEHDAGLLRLLNYSDGGGQILPDQIAPDELSRFPTLLKAMTSGRVASFLDVEAAPESPVPLDRNAIAAAVVDDLGTRIGLLVVRDLTFLNYTRSTFALLGALARCLGSALHQQRVVERYGQAAYFDEHTALFTHKYFQLRLEQERSLVQCTDVRSGILGFQIDGLSGLHLKQGRVILALLASRIRPLVKPKDVLTLGPGFGSLRLFLPGADAAERMRLRSEVLQEFSGMQANLGAVAKGLVLQVTEDSDVTASASLAELRRGA